MRKFLLIALSAILALSLFSGANAQVGYSNGTFTSYEVVNLGNAPTTISVIYYDENGVAATYQPSFPDVPENGTITVQESLEPDLPSGRYSAVVSAGQPIAAIVNQQLGTAGSGSSIAPFSSYTGASSGSTSVILPAIMYNWFNYYTEIYIQNVGTGPANVNIQYTPTSIGACTTGATGVSDPITGIAQYASHQVSQVAETALGAPSVSGCTSYNGRFLGSAKVTATNGQPFVVVVNQIVQNKLFSYNGFTSSGTDVLAPAYMRHYYNYYASLTIANPNTSDANVDLTYTPSIYSNPQTTVHASHTIPAGKSITLYDGDSANSDQSDLLADYPIANGIRFFGTVTIHSTNGVGVVAMVNQEASAAGGNQAGSYNAMLTSEGSQEISLPLIQSEYYGFYTSLSIMSVDGTDPTIDITYTSDGQYSTVKNTSKTYTYTLVDGFLNRYEGPSASADQSDLRDDPSWLSGGYRRFIGSARIKVTSGSNIVAFVNSESITAPYASTRNSMYSYNGFNITP